MGALKCSIWALPLAGEPRPLPELRAWQVNPTEGDAGRVEFSYPETGRNYDLLEACVDDDVDLEVEVTLIRADGAKWTDRAIIDEADLDDVEQTGVGKFGGRLLSCLFDEVVIPYNPGGEQGATTVTGTAGRIARAFLEAAQARGCLQDVTWSFTDSHDSFGQPWARQGTLKFSPNQRYRAMLGTLRGYQLAEWRLTAGRVLVLGNVDGGLGVDRTVGANPLTLEHGRDLVDAPRKWRIRDAVTALFANGKDGLYSSSSDATAQARRGRRIEGTYSFGNTADQGTLDGLTQRRLGTQTGGRTEVSHKVPLVEGSPTPLIDFTESDYLFSATRRGAERRRVRQIQVSGDENGAVEAAVTMGVLIDEAAVRQQDELDALASGESIAGTSTPPPELDDGSIPAAPAGITANSLWFKNNEGAGECSVTAVWEPVPDSRVEGYVVEWRYTANPLGTVWRRMPLTDGTSLSWSAMSPGQGVAVHVAAQNRWGRLGDFSPEYQFATETDGTPPPVASTPIPYASLGFLVVPWDGRGAFGEAMPGDFWRAEVHRSTTSNFTPHRPLVGDTLQLDEAASSTYVGEMRGAMDGLTVDVPATAYAVPANPDVAGDVGAPGTVFYFRLVLVDRTGNASAPSAQGAVEAQAVSGDEIAQLSVSKLRAGVINALVGIGKRLYAGDPAGAGWEGDAAGFRFYSMVNGVRTAVLEFTAATAQLLITGTFQTGRAGRRAVLSGADSTLRFYPSNDETRWAQVASFVPGNYTSSIALQMSSSSAASLDFMTRAYVSPEITGFGVHKPDSQNAEFVTLNLTRDGFDLAVLDSTVQRRIRGGNVFLRRFGWGGSGIEHFNDGGGLIGRCRFSDDGTILLGNGGGSYLRIRPDGTLDLVQNGAYTTGNPNKTFVIDHPLDDPAKPSRWLVHACTESPVAGVEYTGTVEVTGGRATVTLPSYFEALVEPDGRTVQLTAVDDDGVMFMTSAGKIVDGRFSVRTSVLRTVRVHWHVRGARRGQEFNVEPKRADYCTRGDGPYRYLVKRDRDLVPPPLALPTVTTLPESGTDMSRGAA